jgi:hypothetical protein
MQEDSGAESDGFGGVSSLSFWSFTAENDDVKTCHSISFYRAAAKLWGADRQFLSCNMRAAAVHANRTSGVLVQESAPN